MTFFSLPIYAFNPYQKDLVKQKDLEKGHDIWHSRQGQASICWGYRVSQTSSLVQCDIKTGQTELLSRHLANVFLKVHIIVMVLGF